MEIFVKFLITLIFWYFRNQRNDCSGYDGLEIEGNEIYLKSDNEGISTYELQEMEVVGSNELRTVRQLTDVDINICKIV